MKRLLSSLLTLVMVIGVFTSLPVIGNAALVNGDFEYEYINNDTEVAVTSYLGSGGEVYIPNKIDGKYVTSVSDSAFSRNESITYVWMSDYVKSIGSYAFENCTNLKEVDFGLGIKRIGAEAFQGCTSLIMVNLPDSLEEIVHYSYYPGAFEGCTSLKSVVIGNGLKTISDRTFNGCTSLESVVFGENVETIGSSAFNSCSNIEKITLPNSLQSIGDYSFEGCTNLKEVDFGSGVKKIGAEAFQGCTSLIMVNLPDSLEEIVHYSYYPGAFEGCTSLKSVVIGNGLKTISDRTFNGCASLESVVFGKNVETIGSSAFNSCSNIEKITLPDSLQSIGDYSFEGCTNLKEVDFGAGVKKIGAEAFQGCTSLIMVNLPDSLEEIVHYSYYPGAFEGCTSLKSVVIGNGLKTISDRTFNGCTSLESVVFGKNVETIGSSAFNSCSNIEKITLPDSLQSIGDYSFEGCTNLKEVDFGSGVKKIGAEAFQGCTSLIMVNLPDSLEEIVHYSYYPGAFEGCTSLKSVVIGNGLKTISDRTFNGCTSLESVVFGGNVESIGSSAFAGCNNLKKAYFLGNNPTTIEDYNEQLTSAKWYYLPFATDFTQGSVSSTYDSISFDANGGYLVIDDIEEDIHTKYTDNGKVAEPFIPQREGYTFLGWYNNAEGTGTKINIANAKVTKDTTFYAKWEKNTYRIYFDPRSGNVSLGGKDIVYGDAIGQLPTPVLSGDTFNGWYLGMNSSGPKYTATTKMPAKDIVLYAGWQINDSATTVIFDTQGGSFICPVTVTSGTKVNKPADPVRTGYEFVGWYKDANHNEKFDFNTEQITANTTVYAHWKPNLPTAPLNVSVSDVTDTTAVIKWSSVNDVKAFYIYLNGEIAIAVDSDTNEYVVKELQSSTEYTVDVYSVNSTGKSTQSANVKFETIHVCTPSGWIVDKKATVNAPGSKHKECTGCGETLETATIEQLKCSKPKLSKISNTASGVKITWSKVSGADSYEVYRKVKGGSYSKVGTTSKTYFTDKKAKSGKQYYYVVKAVNEAGKSSSSIALSIKYLSDPTLKTPTSTKKGITLKWSKVTGAQGYVVYRKTGNGSYSKLTTVKGVSKVSYVDKSAKKNKKYTYKIKAYYSKTYSAYSNTKTIKDKY